MRLRRTLVCACLIALLAACSGSTSEPDEAVSSGGSSGGAGSGAASSSGATTTESKSGDAAQSLPDPCTLVTKEEASAAMGGAADAGSSDLVSQPGMPTGRTCSYRSTTGRASVQLTIWRVSNDLAIAYKEQQRGFGDVSDVAGVGDSAYRVGWPQLVVRKDEYLMDLAVQMVNYHPDAAQAALKTMATTSIERLAP